jgi:hypothetical protein
VARAPLTARRTVKPPAKRASAAQPALPPDGLIVTGKENRIRLIEKPRAPRRKPTGRR